MSGDVFGNGMLLSNQIRLVAAFDHRHLFLDPDPDPAVGFAERKRLYDLPGSSWDDYDRAKISEGGGVFPLDAKSVPLGPELRLALGLDGSRRLPPAELKTAILRAPVDLFWNGGIGTFVKASDESHAEVGDRANDAIRLDGRDLRVRVVGEGGNLGFTQRGRIEFARPVDASIPTPSTTPPASTAPTTRSTSRSCSASPRRRRRPDAQAARRAAGGGRGRRRRHVLYDNYLQAQILSQEVAVSRTASRPTTTSCTALENDGLLERPIEFLPTAEEMAERHRQGRAMERPELCVLLAYAKRSLKTSLLEASLVDDPYLDRELRGYFPPKVVERFGHLLTGMRCAVSWWPRSWPTTSSTRRASPSSRGWLRDGRRAGRGGARLLRRAPGHGRRCALVGHRGARRHDRPVAAERADGRRRQDGRGRRALVPAPSAAGRPRRRDRAAQRGVRRAGRRDRHGRARRVARPPRRRSRRPGRARRRSGPGPQARVAARADAQPRHRPGRSDHRPVAAGRRARRSSWSASSCTSTRWSGGCSRSTASRGGSGGRPSRWRTT